MALALIAGGVVAGIAVWLAALRPYLVARGKQTSGADFFQAMLGDLTNGKALGAEGDLKARRLARLVTACFCVSGVVLALAGCASVHEAGVAQSGGAGTLRISSEDARESLRIYEEIAGHLKQRRIDFDMNSGAGVLVVTLFSHLPDEYAGYLQGKYEGKVVFTKNVASLPRQGVGCTISSFRDQFSSLPALTTATSISS